MSELALINSLKEKVTEEIKSSFAGLIPDEAWTVLVETERKTNMADEKSTKGLKEAFQENFDKLGLRLKAFEGHNEQKKEQKLCPHSCITANIFDGGMVDEVHCRDCKKIFPGDYGKRKVQEIILKNLRLSE